MLVWRTFTEQEAKVAREERRVKDDCGNTRSVCIVCVRVYAYVCVCVCVGGGGRERERKTVEDSASLPSSEAWIRSTVQSPKANFHIQKT